MARGLSALAAGDTHSARHFAYYAELRAALSMLSASGIGVFNFWNGVVTSNGTIKSVDGSGRVLGTHVMTWLALEAWSKLPSAGSLVGDAITLRSVSLNEALNVMWPSAGSRPLVHELIVDWGVDLKRSLDDRTARNNSSYDPQGMLPLPLSPADIVDFMGEFWRVLEPDGTDAFLTLDRYLFRLSIERQYRAIGGALPQRATEVTNRYANLPQLFQSAVPLSFLLRQNAPEATVIIEARKRTVTAQPTEMLSRAALLLRTATAVTSKLLYDAGYNRASGLRFWSEAYGEVRGFWSNTGGQPSPINDLWSDVQAALDDVALVRQQSAQPLQQSDWASAVANGLPRMCEAERVALWGLVA